MSQFEDEHTEFKRSIAELGESMNDICAMLNKHGKGVLYFGMRNDGTPFPFVITDSTLRDVSRKIYEAIKPQIYPEISREMIEGNEAIVVKFSGEDTPYSAYGRYYMRVADENRAMSPAELRKVMVEKEYGTNWEKQPSGALLSDVDEQTVQNFYIKAEKCGRLPNISYEKKQLLDKLGLLNGEQLNNAGNLLFSKNSPIVLKMAVFATEQRQTFLDINRQEGNIFQLIECAVKYISANIRWKAEISGLHRVEIPEIPLEALREIVVNGFAHAKYNCPVQHEIDIFSDRVSVTSPGSFANEYTPTDFALRDLKSVLRNPLIAKILYMCKEVETFGSGFKKIYSLCNDAAVKVDYQLSESFFTFEFARHDRNAIHDLLLPHGENINLTADEKLVCGLITSNPKISVEDIAAKISKSKRTAYRVLRKIKQNGIAVSC